MKLYCRKFCRIQISLNGTSIYGENIGGCNKAGKNMSEQTHRPGMKSSWHITSVSYISTCYVNNRHDLLFLFVGDRESEFIPN